ncbi:MAG: SRPBCC family protein [Planctomycetaceae bacterium]|nr:SRPBCC family protein [Planctomycetaceae bacterium]
MLTNTSTSDILIVPVAQQQRSWTLSTCIWLPQPLEEVFAYFADAGNLEALTPPWLHFHIETLLPIAMAEGTLIDYRLKLRHIPIRWRTEITGWKPPYQFVDQQLRGPYREWIHTHSFEPHQGGTTVRDDVRYAVPGGRLIHDWFVGPDLRRIFEYRHKVLLDTFALPSGASNSLSLQKS